MSTNSIQSVQREIQGINGRLTNETRKEAGRTDRILKAKRAVSNTSSQSAVLNRLREIERNEREIGQIQKRKANLTKQIADKTRQLHDLQKKLSRAQEKEQQNALDALRQAQLEAQRERTVLLERLSATSASRESKGTTPMVRYDAFISHASEDKQDLVRPLAEQLTAEGFSIWYDETALTVGDSLRRSIDRGLASSRFAVVVLSPDFFAKNWTQYELDGLVTREVSDGGKVILPLWHRVSKDEVRSYSPSLADKVALNTAIYSIDELVQQLSAVLRPTT